jgi:hypothetical protein
MAGWWDRILNSPHTTRTARRQLELANRNCVSFRCNREELRASLRDKDQEVLMTSESPDRFHAFPDDLTNDRQQELEFALSKTAIAQACELAWLFRLKMEDR